jgi:hypothetical protein
MVFAVNVVSKSRKLCVCVWWIGLIALHEKCWRVDVDRPAGLLPQEGWFVATALSTTTVRVVQYWSNPATTHSRRILHIL